jgi:hypothetical protein
MILAINWDRFPERHWQVGLGSQWKRTVFRVKQKVKLEYCLVEFRVPKCWTTVNNRAVMIIEWPSVVTTLTDRDIKITYLFVWSISHLSSVKRWTFVSAIRTLSSFRVRDMNHRFHWEHTFTYFGDLATYQSSEFCLLTGWNLFWSAYFTTQR